MTGKTNWLQLCLLMLASLLFNSAFTTPAKYVRQPSEQVQQVQRVVVSHPVTLPVFVEQAQKALLRYDIFSTPSDFIEFDIGVAFKHQHRVCLSIAQAPPCTRLILPPPEDEPALS